MMIDQTMFCEWNECESEACPRKDEIPRGRQDVKNLGWGSKHSEVVVQRTAERTGKWCS